MSCISALVTSLNLQIFFAVLDQLKNIQTVNSLCSIVDDKSPLFYTIVVTVVTFKNIGNHILPQTTDTDLFPQTIRIQNSYAIYVYIPLHLSDDAD